MRHGDASFNARSDAERPLSDVGIEQSNLMGKWLSSQEKTIDFCLVSPYLRAQQTFETVKNHISILNSKIESKLTPDGYSQLIVDSVLAMNQNISTVLLVSHLPMVSYLLHDFCPSAGNQMFSTAQICCVEIDEKGSRLIDTQRPNI